LEEEAMHHNPGFLKLVSASKSRIREIDIEAVQAQLDAGKAFHLIDVREESEWNAGRLPGAIWLGKGIIERDVEATVSDRDAELVLYCGGGFRSALAADALQEMGYRNVMSMAGGYRAWTSAGYSVVQGSRG